MGTLRSIALALVACAALVSVRPASAAGLHGVHVRGEAAYGALEPGGSPVRLTLDPRWQRAAEKLLARSGAHEAAIVASDVRTGRILVWASRGPRDAVATAFAPSASLFKLVTAAALLETGRVGPGTRQCFTGGERAIEPRDLEGRGTSCQTLSESLAKSTNLVLARLAHRHLGAADLRRAATALGFHGEVPIDVRAGKSVARVPDDPFGMAKAAAGFWNGTLTPLGALFAMQTIANDGERVRFHVIDRESAQREVVGRAIDASVARSLRLMLEGTATRGTAAKAFRRADGSPALRVPIAAKTGTLVGGKPSRMYSWFAAFAPLHRPEVAVAVLLANDLRWHTKATLVGRDVLAAWLDGGDERRARRRASGARRR